MSVHDLVPANVLTVDWVLSMLDACAAGRDEYATAGPWAEELHAEATGYRTVSEVLSGAATVAAIADRCRIAIRAHEEPTAQWTTAAELAAGSLRPLYGALPSWRWTDLMCQRLDEGRGSG